jgi:uncharacterized membrane protein
MLASPHPRGDGDRSGQMERTGPAATHASVQELAAALALDEATHRRAVELARLAPEHGDWLRYLDRFLTAAGALLIVAGIAAFVAWNWSALGHLTKFALVQFMLAGTVVMACVLKFDTVAGRAALVAAAILVGILLALFGQVYQTGADPYGLFVAWALLILPWVLVGRQPALWLLGLVLLNVSLILYWTQVLYPPPGWWDVTQLLGPLFMLGASMMDWRLASWLFALNGAALVSWEFAARGDTPWLRSRLLPRAAAVLALATVVGPTLVLIFAATVGQRSSINVASPLLLVVAIAGTLTWYRYRKPDLFMLTAAIFGAILVITALAARMVQDVEALLWIALLLIAQVAGAAYWLRHVAARWEAVA